MAGKPLSNHEIVTLAVYLLGGDSAYVDTEDVAVKANEIAPGRFTWRKHRDQINLELIRVYLSEAKKPKRGRYLIGSGNEGWMLTEKGLAFSRSRVRELKAVDLSRRPLTQKERQWLRRERGRMLAENAFVKFQSGKIESISQREAEAFFHLDDYVTGNARERKLVRIVNAFGDDPELGAAVKELVKQVRRE